MSYILETNVVKYACSCGNINPISKLYFCRHCLVTRCGFCVCHEVDSHFCSNCLENIPSSEAKLKKNCCNSCFVCPCCQHTLSARATSIQIPRKGDEDKVAAAGVGSVPDNQLITRKMYYLSCLACRWTTRDAGIPDQTSATGQWPELEYAHAIRFALFMEHYQNVMLQEKQEKQDYWRRKAPKQNKFPSLTDRTGLTVSMARRQLGWSDKNMQQKIKPIAITPSVASADVIELPDTIFTKEINLKNITTIRQRLSQPSNQSYTVKKLYPQHKSLSIKKSLRCKHCEHNVIKPEFNPISIKYRIQLFAIYHLPEVRLIKTVNDEPLYAGHSAQIMLKLINPTVHDMTITIMDLPTEEEESLLIEEMKNLKLSSRQSIGGGVGNNNTSINNSLLSSTSITSPAVTTATFSRQISLTEDPRMVDQKTNATITLPDSSFILYHRDDTADFDEDIQIPKEEIKFIVWRRSNKVAVRLTVNPLEGKAGDDVIIGFSMQHTYVNTVVPTTVAYDKKEPHKHALNTRVYIKLGTLQEKPN